MAAHPEEKVLGVRANSEPTTKKEKAFPAERTMGGKVPRLEWHEEVRGRQLLLRLRAGRGETEQGLVGQLQTHRCPRVLEARRLVCQWHPPRLLQSEERSQVVMLCVSPAPHL